MAEIRRRYFQLMGSLLDEYMRWRSSEHLQHKARLKALCDRVGTDTLFLAVSIAGIQVDGFLNVGQKIDGTKPSKDRPDSLVPNLRTKAGRALKLELESLTYPEPNALREMISPGQPNWIVGDYICNIGIHKRGEYVFASIPRDVEYTPHPEMVEWKEWEYLKLVDEIETAKKVAQEQGVSV